MRTTRAKKHFGQHFLEPPWVDKVVRLIDPQPGQTFIEIGPGRGALTRPLAARAKEVTAYEIDRDLATGLREASAPNVTIVEGDFLEANPDLRSPNAIRVAGNLPYNVASPILFKLVDLSRRTVALADATVMLQREVADRVTSGPGSRDYGVLSVLIQHRAGVERLLFLPPGAFRPPPKVHSAVVRLRFHPPDPPVRDEQLLADLVQAVFTRRRKTLANALLAFGARPTRIRPAPDSRLTRDRLRQAMADADLDGGRRPETLTVAEFVRLADALSSNA